MMSVADEIAKLDALRQSGAITEEEYEKLKTALLEKQVSSSPDAVHISIPSFNVNNWAMFIHLSQFCGYVIPLAGFIVPIVLWQLKKEEDPVIDLHGKIVANWLITEFIMAVVFVFLCAFMIGIPLVMALAVAALALPIIGGIRANNGEAWPYPLSIRFFPLDE